MKACPYCSRQNHEKLSVCEECSTSLTPELNRSFQRPSPAIIWAAIAGLALLVCARDFFLWRLEAPPYLIWILSSGVGVAAAFLACRLAVSVIERRVTVALFALSFASLVMSSCLFGFGYEQPRFSLGAKLLPSDPSKGPLRIAIELGNISRRPQTIIMPVLSTTSFGGVIYLRNTNGRIYEFVQTNGLEWQNPPDPIHPRLKLGSGASHVFEHVLSDFIDISRTGLSASDPDKALATEFQRGCEFWCQMEIWQSMESGNDQKEDKMTALVRSSKIRHP